MSDQAAPESSSKTWLTSIKQVLNRILHGTQTLTERLVHLLRSLAMISLFGMIALIVVSAIKNHDTIVVKPFTVSPNLKQQHENAGSIIANLLKQQLHNEHSKLNNHLFSKQSEIAYFSNSRLVSMEQQQLAGGDLKLPETGITINHIVDFISSLFGRENLKGTVYEENGKLHVQIELKGHIINFNERNEPTQNDSYFQRLNHLFQQNSQQILSGVSDDLGLYYYCTHRITINQTELPFNESYHELLTTCAKAYEAKTRPSDLLDIKQQLKTTFAPKYTSENNKIVASTITQMEQIVQQRYRTLCQSSTLDLAQQAACSQDNQTTPAQQAPDTASSPVMATTPETTASLPEQTQAMVKSALSATPDNLVELHPDPPITQAGLVEKLITYCQSETESDLLLSNRLEESATQLFHNGLLTQAAHEYQAAIQAYCDNAPAWANLGILLSTSTEPQWQQYSQAEKALKQGIQLNKEASWMHHSLCIAQALQTDKPLEHLQSEACHHARKLTPANTVLYDKLFYLEIAQQYESQQQLDLALGLYQQAATTDNRRTCSMYRALSAMQRIIPHTSGITTQAQLCTIYKESQAIEDGACNEQFTQLDC